MCVEVVCRENNLKDLIGVKLITCEEAIKLAFGKIQNEEVESSWKDALSCNVLEKGILKLLEIPTFGCFTDIKKRDVRDSTITLNKIWSIGGETGWYYANWLWSLRGFIDKLFGGTGLNRGRKNKTLIFAGDSLDFWRVIYANKKDKRLLLYAEMKFPGEAWLEFKITDNILVQTATMRPRGLLGRIYWYTVLPFHVFIFKGLIKKLCL